MMNFSFQSFNNNTRDSPINQATDIKGNNEINADPSRNLAERKSSEIKLSLTTDIVDGIMTDYPFVVKQSFSYNTKNSSINRATDSKQGNNEIKADQNRFRPERSSSEDYLRLSTAIVRRIMTDFPIVSEQRPAHGGRAQQINPEFVHSVSTLVHEAISPTEEVDTNNGNNINNANSVNSANNTTNQAGSSGGVTRNQISEFEVVTGKSSTFNSGPVTGKGAMLRIAQYNYCIRSLIFEFWPEQ